jgi:hypothetical protein
VVYDECLSCAADIADAVAFPVAAPPRMNVAELIVLATIQG